MFESKTLDIKGFKGPYHILTNVGFHYVLLDTPTQVHFILQNYLEVKLKENKDLIVKLIIMIFNFALSQNNKSYKLREETLSLINNDFE